MCSLYRKCINIIGAMIIVEKSLKISNVTLAILKLIGILDAYFMKKILADDFLSLMKEKELDMWIMAHGKSVNESLKQWVIEYVGEPIHHVLR